MTEVLDLPWPQAAHDHDAAVLRAFLAAPQLRALWRQHADPAAAEAQARRMARLVSDYAGTRSAVAEIVTAIVLLVVGALVFRAITPGMLSLALFAFLLTRTDAAFAGRAYAAYGGVYIAASLMWLWVVEGMRPDRWDLIGAGVCLLGAAVILFGPRGTS